MNKFNDVVELACGDLKASISPKVGMSLIAFSIEGISLLDLSREEAFYQNRKGLGPLIGPHFNQGDYLPDVDASRFEHIKYLEAIGVKDIFQHGVGRYMSWDYTTGHNYITGKITSKSKFEGYSLKYLSGFDFEMSVTYRLDEIGLAIEFDIQSEKFIQVGTHFYYDLVDRDTAYVNLDVEGAKQKFHFKGENCNDAFRPNKSKSGNAKYQLVTDLFELDTLVKVNGSRNETFDSFVLFSPIGSSFACLEPISEHDREINNKKEFRSEIKLNPRKLR